MRTNIDRRRASSIASSATARSNSTSPRRWTSFPTSCRSHATARPSRSRSSTRRRTAASPIISQISLSTLVIARFGSSKPRVGSILKTRRSGVGWFNGARTRPQPGRSPIARSSCRRRSGRPAVSPRSPKQRRLSAADILKLWPHCRRETDPSRADHFYARIHRHDDRPPDRARRRSCNTSCVAAAGHTPSGAPRHLPQQAGKVSPENRNLFIRNPFRPHLAMAPPQPPWGRRAAFLSGA